MTSEDIARPPFDEELYAARIGPLAAIPATLTPDMIGPARPGPASRASPHLSRISSLGGQ
jgi:hypothetical protein